MYFTQEDYKKIENWLHRNSVKDTEFQEALPFTGKEIVTIVQDGHNRKVNIQEFINQLYKHGVEDFLNVTNTYRANNITLKEAIRLIPAEARKEGQVITFLNTDGNWEIYQFTGKLNQWNNTTLWNNPFDWEKFVVDSILPDEEDLTKSEPDAKGNSYLSLKNRKYEPDKYSGLGRKILRRRVVEIEDPIYGTQEKNLLLQADFAEDNTVYVVRYDFTLNGQDITLPDNSYIEYEGGSISDGNIIDRAGGINRVVLKKNIANDKNILTQEMISKSNTIYECKYDFDLNGQDITLPDNSYIEYNGGSISNGNIIDIAKGLNRVILRKNIKEGKNILTQDMINKENTIYVIQYDFILASDVIIPANCVLEFDGGSISGNKTLTGTNTAIKAGLVKIFNINVILAGTWNIAEVYPEWFGAKGDGVTDDSDAIQKAILMYCPVYFQCKCYGIYKQIDLVNSTFLKGCHTELTVTEGTQLNGNTPNFDNKIGTIKALASITSVLNINGNCIVIDGIGIDCDTKSSYGIYSDETSRSRIKINNCYVQKATVANIRISTYLTQITNTIVYNAPKGFKLGRTNTSKETSLTLNNCYSKSCTVGYEINSYIYSSIISCACDSANTAYSFYDMNGCNILDCGCEDIDIAIEINNKIIDFKIDGLYIGNTENRVNKAIVIHSTNKAYGNVYFGRLNYVLQGTGMCVQVPTTSHEFGDLLIYCDNTINKFACEGNFILVESNKNLLDTIDGTVTSTMQSAPTVTKIGNGKYIISGSTISPGEQFEMDIAQIELKAGTYLLGNLNCSENYRAKLNVGKNNYGSGVISSCRIGDCSFTLDSTTTVYIAFWIQPYSSGAQAVPAITLSPYLYKIG